MFSINPLVLLTLAGKGAAVQQCANQEGILMELTERGAKDLYTAVSATVCGLAHISALASHQTVSIQYSEFLLSGLRQGACPSAI